MICARCIRARSALRLSCRGASSPLISRSFSTTNHFREPAAATPESSSNPPPATSTGPSQPFSTPLSPHPNTASLGETLRPKPKSIVIPVSSCPAGTRLKGLNYIKGRDDPIALPEEAYPEWLWRCLDVKVKEGEVEGDEGDAFCKPLVHSNFYISSLNQAINSVLMETNVHSQVEKAPPKSSKASTQTRTSQASCR